MIKTLQNIVFFISILLFFDLSLHGQVVINEFSCSNVTTIQDNYFEYSDWIELYNTSATPVNLAGYYLSDKLGNPTKWEIPSVTISGNDYLIFFASSRDEMSGGYIHTGFKLTQTKPEYIVFSDTGGTIIEQIQLIPAQTDHSRGRTTDGASTWSLFTGPTPDASNSNAMQEYATIPQFSQAPGLYTSSITLDITSPDLNVTIYYTTDGTIPTTSSNVVAGSITVNATQVIRARAFSSVPDVPASFIETNTYFINDSHTIPVVSISGNLVENLLNGSSIEPLGTFEYFDSDQNFMDQGTGEFNKHGNDSWAYDQRGIDYIARDQFGYNYAVKYKVFKAKDRNKFQRLILKAAANDNYPFEDGAHIRDAYVHTLSQIGHLKLDERTYEPCILYVNGKYWGVYEIREKVDDSDFTNYYYNQDRFNIQFIKTWGSTWAEYGGNQALTDWNTLYNFIMSNDMSVQTNYDSVKAQYNVKSLVDYVVLNSYIVCSDWLNWNTGWWRGLNPNGDKKKWRYILWDEDATFGHYINYTSIPDQSVNADPCNPEALPDPGGQGHIPILNKLRENPEFEQYYISRFIDLSNSTFKCDFMLPLLDSMIITIEPEMQRQINRWGGTFAGWQANVQQLRDFIETRCVTINNGMIDCYDLTGPFDITIIVDPPLSGNVEINSLELDTYPWTGSYFGDIDILLDADPDSGYTFEYWELYNHTVSPNSTDENVILNLVTSDTIIAHFIFAGTVNVDLGNDTTLCYGESLALDAGNSGATYYWSTGDTSQNIIVNSEGTYIVTVTKYGYSVSDSITVNISDEIIVSLGEDQSLCANPSPTLTSGNFGNGYIYLWEHNGQPISSVSDSYTTELPGEYILSVTDPYGCKGSDTIYIDECILTIPNTFTPNNDGKNDTWHIENIDVYQNNIVEIYNRNGNLVYKKNNYQNNWDGKYNGEDLPAATYYYIINLGNELKVYKGSITIVR